MSHTFSVASAKQQATALRRRLVELGHTVSHGQALEAVAASHGFADWNRLAAHLGQAPSHLPTPAIQCLFAKPGEAASTVVRQLAMALLDDAPQGNVWIFHPYSLEARLDGRTGQPIVTPHDVSAKGQIFLNGQAGADDATVFASWLEGVLAVWKEWEGKKRTQAIMLMDAQLLKGNIGAVSKVLVSTGVQVFFHSSERNRLTDIGQHHLTEVTASLHHVEPWNLMPLLMRSDGTTTHIVGDGDDGFTHAELATVGGLVRLTGRTLAGLPTHPRGPNPRYDRFVTCWGQEQPGITAAAATPRTL